jgi:Tfp pilus assembly protein PilO
VFSIQSAGSFHTMARFLTELGQEQRIINIENLQLVGSGNPNDPSRNLGCSFLMVTYIFKESQ